MPKKYFPVLLSKDGELLALSRLEQNVKDNISPIIEIIPDIFIENQEVNRAKSRAERERKLNKVITPRNVVLKNPLETMLTTHWRFDQNQILLDFRHCFPNLKLASISGLLNSLQNAGVNVIPVVHHNAPPEYIKLAKDFCHNFGMPICIRASASGLKNYNTNLIQIFSSLGFPESNVILSLDFGFIPSDYSDLACLLSETILTNIPSLNKWLSVVVGFGSFPKDLSHLKPSTTAQMFPRNEWIVWKYLLMNPNINTYITYSDYGIKYPIYSDEAAYAGSISIKYSTTDDFVVYRGILSENHDVGHGQYIIHSKILVTDHSLYPGNSFSWGDERIDFYSKQNPKIDKSKAKSKQKPTTGNAKDWVAIGQNHHITLIHSLL